jgi:hypothetical protein
MTGDEDGGKFSLLAGGWRYVMRDGEQRRRPMMAIPGAKQLHSQVDYPPAVSTVAAYLEVGEKPIERNGSFNRQPLL